MMNRRTLLKTSCAYAGFAATGSYAFAETEPKAPSFLADYADLYAKDPRKAALTWFEEAQFGLFVHYGLYSLLEGHYKGKHSRPAEWVLRNCKVPLPEYEQLADQFTAEKFDADFITDMALDAGMKYVNLTTRHHDSYCLWDTSTTEFKSTNSPAKRDLVAELAENCHKKGLGLCLYFSHGRDWRHPHGPESLFPAEKVDYQEYVDYISTQVTELLTHYGPIAAIWLDGIGGAWNTQKAAGGKDVLQTEALYEQIRSLQPQVLISYKQGFLGTEDFMAPERHFKGKPTKPLELCNTLQGYSWGYDRKDEGRHRDVRQVMKMLADAKAMPANLLLNTGPLPDGSIHPDDIKTIKEVGQRLREQA